VNKTPARITIILTACGLLIACQFLNQGTALPIQSTSETTYSCPPLPPNFKEEDLIGTWTTSYSLTDKDTLVIKDDGTYKQIYDDPDASQYYESDWQEWWIEYRESGYIRLHLDGMRRAGEIDSIFNRTNGGIDPELFTAIDYCENDVIEMPDEIVLIVTGTTDNVLRGIILRQTRLAGSEWTWSFQLEDE
jgi:hypothetical protein